MSEQSTDFPSKIRKVTVFKDRAQLFRHAKIPGLKPGDHVLTFSGNWSNVDRNTLQVAIAQGADRALLRSVQFSTIESTEDIRPQQRELDAQLKELQKELAALSEEISIRDVAIQSYNKVSQKFTQGMKQDGDSRGPVMSAAYSAERWMEFNKFITDGIRENTQQKRELEKKARDVQHKVNDAQSKRHALGRGDYRRTSRDVAEVLLTVGGGAAATDSEPVTLSLQLSYIVRGASWTPLYDLRVSSRNKTMTVTYNAMVKQACGEDWDGVKLELSTAQPHVGGDAPAMSPWYLRVKRPEQDCKNFYAGEELEERAAPQQQMMMQQMMSSNMMNAMPVAASAPMPQARSRARAHEVESANVKSHSTATTFEIGTPTSVQSGSQSSKVTITQQEYPVYFRYSAIPKVDARVYLKVKTINASPFPLLSGKANVFQDNQLVSTTQMDNVAPDEEFWTFLGVDEDVSCERIKVHEKRTDTEAGFLSKAKQKIEYAFKFKLKNAKRTVEELVIWDQMPIVEDKRITLTMVTPPHADEGKQTAHGHPFFKINDTQYIEWIVNLKGGEERTFEFVFHVEAPAGDDRLII